MVSSVVFFLSIVAGMLTLLSLAGNLEKAERPSIYGKNIVPFSLAQIACFAAALACTLAFGFMAM